MRIVKNDNCGREVGYRIDPFVGGKDPKWRSVISVDKTAGFAGDKWRPASVNWSCVGSVDAEAARKFADGVAVAVTLAEQLEEKFPAGALVGVASAEPVDDAGAQYAYCRECDTQFPREVAWWPAACPFCSAGELEAADE